MAEREKRYNGELNSWTKAYISSQIPWYNCLGINVRASGPDTPGIPKYYNIIGNPDVFCIKKTHNS